MIADPRADALMTAFTGQWLQLRNLDKVTPDMLLFPDFDDNVRQAFRRETELLFASIVRENRSVLDLLDADYTFVNERLARHYGIPGVYGSRFRRVPVTDPNRRGLLGHGSILSMTVGGQPHVARAARQVHHLEPAEHAAAAAAGRRAGSRRERAQGPAVDRSRAARTASRQPGVRARAIATSIRSASRSRTSTPSASGGSRRAKGWRSTRRACWRTGRKMDGPVGAAQGAAGPAGRVRRDRHREDADLRARPGPRAGRHARRPRHRPQSAAAQNYAMQAIMLGIVRSAPFQMRTKLTRYCGARRPSTTYGSPLQPRPARSSRMIVTKKHLPRRTFLRGALGAVVAMPFLDAMIPALAAQADGAAVPVRGDLHPERHLSAAVASGHGRQRLRVQADHAAARAVSAATW